MSSRIDRALICELVAVGRASGQDLVASFIEAVAGGRVLDLAALDAMIAAGDYAAARERAHAACGLAASYGLRGTSDALAPLGRPGADAEQWRVQLAKARACLDAELAALAAFHRSLVEAQPQA